jgi:hypothetical protein|tara:strand:+ start:424 stop:1386 length:963 start_codon:yes stop_codon:yes gene_type:complete
LYHYKYELGYRSSATIPAFLIGTAVHVGLEHFWKGDSLQDALIRTKEYMSSEPYFSEDGWIEKLRVQAYVTGYYSRWLNDRDLYEVVGVEHEFTTTWKEQEMAGKLDVLVRRKSDGKLTIIEHKTASKFAKADEPDSPYWQKLSMDTQLCFYVCNIDRIYGEIPEVIYDVIVKSRSTPLKGKARKRKDESDAAFAQRKAEGAETRGEYLARVKEAYINEGHERYLRKTIHLTVEEINRKMDELDTAIGDIRKVHDEWSEVSENDGYWTQKQIRIRNTTACMGMGSTCEFLGVCTGVEQLDDPKFEKKEKLHSELTIKETQ